jgi:hypothetical protein
MSEHTTILDYEIGGNSIHLSVGYSYVKGRPATGPTYSSGGEPSEPPECDVHSLRWVVKGKPGEPWNTIERGPLFDLIAQDDWIYPELCDAAEVDPREYEREDA